jgi:rhamnosyltransferase subunit B
VSASRAVVLVALGSVGDLLPFLAVGKVLSRRGHEVIVATHDEYEATCRMVGMEFRSIWDGRRSREAFRHASTSSPSEIWERVWREFFLPAMQPTFSAVKAVAQSRRCTVVAPWSAMGAVAACEALDLPLCTVYLSPHAVGQDDAGDGAQEPYYERALDQARLEQGLPGAGRPTSRTRVAFFPKWFYPPRRPWPDQVTATGFPLHDDALVPVSLAKLRRFLDAGEAPFVFTPGSFMDQAGDFFETALSACAELGRRAIFLTPHHRQIPPALPDSVLHLDYVPLHRILPRCAALFHHGGVGTCAQAMRAGAPQVITPIFFDQFDNAERVEQLNAGFALDRGPLSVSTVADAMLRALALGATGSGCTALRSRFGDDPSEAICDSIEALA